MHKILKTLFNGIKINRTDSKKLFQAIIDNKIKPEELSAILISMKIRKETCDEISGAVDAFLESSKPFPKPDYVFADIVGTGGDNNGLNISTASAIVAAGCNVKIIKHGNYGISSNSGSFDLLKSFGINIHLNADKSRKLLDDIGICFLFSPQYYSGFKNAMEVRKILKVRTIFNIVGPLINPARPSIALIGVYSDKLITPVIETLRLLNYKRAAVVCGGGMDEVVLHTTTKVAELNLGKIKYYNLTAFDFGLKSQSFDLANNFSVKENKNIITNVLQGKGEYVYESIIAVNVALLLKLFGKENLYENTIQALNEIRSGKSFSRIEYLAKQG